MLSIRKRIGNPAILLALLVLGSSPLRAQQAPKTSARPAKPAARPQVQRPESGPVPGDAAARPSPFARQSPPRLTIPAGTELSVRLGDTLDTKRVHTGDRFSATLEAPITLRGRVIVPRGTVFEGHVTDSKNSGRFRGQGVLGLALDSFRLRDTTYRVLTSADVRTSTDSKKRNIVLVGAGAVASNTKALITGKRNVKLPADTPLVFSLRRQVAVRG